MLTRKRAREMREHPKSYGFDAIMESCAQFLELQDCGSVAQLNRRFHRVLWFYILQSSTRVIVTPIDVNKKSARWLRKYSNELKSQSLILNNYGQVVDLVGLGVTHVRCLRVNDFHQIPNLPPVLHSLHVYNCESYQFPEFPPIKECFISHCGFPSAEVVLKLPKTLEKLSILYTWVDFDKLPEFPNLSSLEICIIDEFGSKFLQRQCGTLSTLILYLVDFPALECLRGVKLRRLVVRSWLIIDLSPLSDATIEELDLTQCLRVTGLWNLRSVKNMTFSPLQLVL
jgi:hypothetical protein